ncbi:hypothetical protein BLOT_003770 [Blomia tropicalis]|nr:hypothetical protein BLOT_003770 [Blomia tropicalis]
MANVRWPQPIIVEQGGPIEANLPNGLTPTESNSMHLSSLYNLSNTMNQSATPLMDHNRRTTMKRSMNALSSKFDDDFKHVQNHGSDSKKHKCK